MTGSVARGVGQFPNIQEDEVMTWRSRPLIGAILVAASLLAADRVRAETCTLQVKRLGKSSTTSSHSEHMYRITCGQQISIRLSLTERLVFHQVENDPLAEFGKLVTKEPQYNSEYPLRGVVKLGDEKYAFVLDTKESAQTKETGEADKEAQTPAKSETPGQFRTRLLRAGTTGSISTPNAAAI